MLVPIKLTFGSDPEGFLYSKLYNRIIGSEKVIPEKGLESKAGKIVRDGVQFELNPNSEDSIPALGRNIGSLFKLLVSRLDAKTHINFDGLVEVARDELDSLTPKSRILGCMPSHNAYGADPIDVDPVNYRKRSAGGHIHTSLPKSLMNRRQSIIPFLDVFVGLFSVLLDRDPGAAERRENYGRAGEFRLPNYGIEYRAISNFWLRDYTLMSFVFGMTQIAYSVAYSIMDANNTTLRHDLISAVDIKEVVTIINRNDYKNARKLVVTLLPILKRELPDNSFVMHNRLFDLFIDFADMAERKGIDAYFPTQSIVSNWLANRQLEFGSFLKNV